MKPETEQKLRRQLARVDMCTRISAFLNRIPDWKLCFIYELLFRRDRQRDSLSSINWRVPSALTLFRQSTNEADYTAVQGESSSANN